MKSIDIPNASRIASRLANEKLKSLLTRIRITVALETPLRRARSVTEISSSRTRFCSLTASCLAGSWTGIDCAWNELPKTVSSTACKIWIRIKGDSTLVAHNKEMGVTR